jgi:hypothetical protein
MVCARCLGKGWTASLINFRGTVECLTCKGTGEVGRPSFTLAYDPKKDIVEHYDRPIR